MRFKTPKGVIRPGDVILQIVPTKDELVIDARVQPIDGKSIRPGQTAEVHLLPYVQRNLPMIEGRVISITPDTLSDERTGEKYYEAKVIVERNRLKEIAPEVELSPGMPADVMIVTGARSAFRYLMEPIERSFRLSFRQS
jgi:multidrug efflux pump subunit AcrA (membrane-fusion protein)